MPGTIRPPSLSDLGPEQSSRALTAVAGRTPTAPASVRVSQTMPKVCPECGVHYPAEFKVCPRDAAELTESAVDVKRDELIGQTLGGTYTIVGVIGEGGMGRVYEARHNRIASKRFAVKMLHPEFARQPEVLSRFQREAEAAAAIKSPYVVDVFDVDRSEDGRPYLVAELLEGKELADYLNERGRPPIPLVVRITRQICRALSAAHAKGVVHRDMKPENVFLTGDLERPTAKVIDFGISKVGDAPGTALTKTGMIMGTPSYMAPEQAKGEKVDHRADIYAVGAILYCALTGQRPFDHADPTVTLTAVLLRDPPRPRSIEPSIPEALELVVQRAMSKSPADRHQTMAELEADLMSFDTGVSGARANNPSIGPPPSGALDVSTHTARDQSVAMVRPMIVLYAGLGLAGSLGLALTAITGVVRLLRGGGARANLTSTETAFLVLGALFTVLTPAILGLRYLRQRVWDNTALAVALADRLRLPIVIGFLAYGISALAIHVLDSVLLHRAAGMAWPGWDLVLVIAALGGAAGGYAVSDLGAKRR